MSRDRRRRRHPPRIFIGPLEIAGYFGALAAGFRAIGIPADFVDLEVHPFDYRHLEGSPGIVLAATTIARRRRTARGAGRGVWLLLELLTRFAVLLWAARRYDVFIYGFGRTILKGADYRVLAWLRKPMIFVLMGSDTRAPYIDGNDLESHERMPHALVALTRRKKKLVLRLERHGLFTVSSPLSVHFSERDVISHVAVGFPARPELTYRPVTRPEAAEIVKALHAPSHPTIKGTRRIREVVAQLRREGVPIELVELTGVPHDRVLAELQKCDFVIDQLYSDIPMGGFATEAAWAGRPAIVGSYGWDDLRRVIPPQQMPPVEACHPDDLESSVRRLVSDPTYREDLGTRARNFVSRQWAPEHVAARYMALIDGRAGQDWKVDPYELRYAYGCGTRREQIARAVRGILSIAPVQSLQLSDKPELQGLMVALASEPPPDAHPSEA